jgi:hypothetical protein
VRPTNPVGSGGHRLPRLRPFSAAHNRRRPTTPSASYARLVDQRGGKTARCCPDHLERLGTGRADPLPKAPDESGVSPSPGPESTCRRNAGSLERKTSAVGTSRILGRTDSANCYSDLSHPWICPTRKKDITRLSMRDIDRRSYYRCRPFMVQLGFNRKRCSRVNNLLRQRPAR